MTLTRYTTVLLLAFSLPALAQQAPAAAKLPKFERENYVYRVAPGKWKGPHLPDGQPDVQGHYSNTIANHANLTQPQGGGRNADPSKPRAGSRVIEPADGKLPYLPWAAERHKELRDNFADPKRPEHIETFARCAPGGPIKSFLWHGHEVRQYPGYVLFLFDSGYRLIRIGQHQKHLPANIKLWNGDSIGYWDGNTLVVDVANDNAKARLGRSAEFYSENAHITERYVFDNNRERYYYTAQITDPTVFLQPVTIEVPLRRVEAFAYDDWNNFLKPVVLAAGSKPGKTPVLENYERQCVENNGGFGVAQ
ncbi:MAG: hypothetical protein QM776_10890 [Rhodocyclaceae bacterium]